MKLSTNFFLTMTMTMMKSHILQAIPDRAFGRRFHLFASASTTLSSMSSADVTLKMARGGGYVGNSKLLIPNYRYPLRGGSATDERTLWSRSQQHQTQRLFAVSSPTSSSSNNDAERQSILRIAFESLCSTMEQSKMNFGGIPYTNTIYDNRYRVLFVLGGPGAGKGTQSEFMEQHYPTAHFSVGQLLRDELAKEEESPHKKIIQETLDSGRIVPVEISLELLCNAMKNSKEKFVLVLVDGFPRNFDNLQGWCNAMKDVTSLQCVLVYQCPLDVLEERIIQRAAQSGRSDDNREAVQKRFRTFEQETVPVIDVLRDASERSSSTTESAAFTVVDIQGNQPIDDVWVCTQKVLNQLIIDDVLTANAELIHSIKTENASKYQELCDPSWFRENDSLAVLHQQEGNSKEIIQIDNASVDVISGKHVAVSYDRYIDGILMKEKRIWSHHGAAGWQLLHFVRTPKNLPHRTSDEHDAQTEPDSRTTTTAAATAV